MDIPMRDIPSVDILQPQDPQKVRRLMDSLGAVVFKNVLSQIQCDHAITKFYEWMTVVGNGESCYEPWWDNMSYSNSGVMTGGSIQQSDMMWYIRANPKLMHAFSLLWDMDYDKLMHTFDGCGAFREPGNNPKLLTDKSWIHCDQRGPTRRFQGVVNLMDTSPETGSTVVVLGSHLTHDEWVCEDEQCYDQLERQAISVHLDAGDLLVWDSRLAHCSTCAKLTQKTDPNRTIRRLVAYISMEPRSYGFGEETRAARETAIRRGYGGGHEATIMHIRGSGPHPDYESWNDPAVVESRIKHFA